MLLCAPTSENQTPEKTEADSSDSFGIYLQK